MHAYNHLGIILDSHMTFSPLFAEGKRLVSYKIYMLVKIRNNIDTQCALTIYKQTILPLLDCASDLLVSGNVSVKSDLQKIMPLEPVTMLD